jgi:hypothetical protein
MRKRYYLNDLLRECKLPFETSIFLNLLHTNLQRFAEQHQALIYKLTVQFRLSFVFIIIHTFMSASQKFIYNKSGTHIPNHLKDGYKNQGGV